MMVLINVPSFEAEAQSMNTRGNKITKVRTTGTVPPTTSELISGVEMLINEMSAKCPMTTEGGLTVIESASFKNKCMSMTIAYTDKFEELVDGSTNNDYSYMDYHVKLTISRMIKAMNVSANTFGQTGISFSITYKDNYGDVIWFSRVTPKEYIAFYNELTRNGEMPLKGEIFNLESFRQMVNSWNASTPLDLGDGITLFRVTMEGTNIYYDASTPYRYVLSFELLDDEEKEEERKEVAQEVYNLYSALDSSKKNLILNNMIKLGITIHYRYYAGSERNPYNTISLPSSYIKRVGSQRQ